MHASTSEGYVEIAAYLEPSSRARLRISTQARKTLNNVYPPANAYYVYVGAKVTREGTREGSHRHTAEHTHRVL